MAAAQAAYQELEAQYPEMPQTDDAIFWQGRIAFEQNQSAEAAKKLQGLLERYPTSDLIDEARYWLGKVLLAQDRAKEAITVLEDMVADAPDARRKAQVSELLGDAWWKQGDAAKSARWYLAARAGFDAGEPDAARLDERIRALISGLAKLEDAQELARRFGKDPPGDLARFREVELLSAAGKLDEARSRAGDFLKAYPGHPFEEKIRERLRLLETAAQVDPGKVGVLLPLSGKYAVFGERALRGIDLAQQESVKGHKGVEFVIRDTKGIPEEAAKAVEDLVLSEHVVAIVGPLLSVEAAAAVQRAQALETPILALSQKEGLTQAGPYVFRYFLTVQDQVRAVLAEAVERRCQRAFAVLYPDSALGRDFFERFWKEAESRGAWVVAAESYPPDTNDFREEITRLVGTYFPDARSYEDRRNGVAPDARSSVPLLDHINYSYWARFHPDAKPPDSLKWPPPANREAVPIIDFDAIFIPDSFEKVAQIAPQLPYNSVQGVDLLGIAAWDNPKLPKLGGNYVEGSIFVDGFFAESKNPQIEEFVKRYREAFRDEPGLLEAAAHDGALLVRDILSRRPEGLKRAEFRQRLLEVREMPLLMGRVSMGEDGDARLPLTLLTVANGRISELP